MRHLKRKRTAQLLRARGGGSRPQPLSMYPQSPNHIHWYRGHHVSQVALSHWGILLWGPLGILKQITYQSVLEKRKGVRTFIISLLGDPFRPDKQPHPPHHLPPGALGGAVHLPSRRPEEGFFALNLWVHRGPMDSFLNLEWPLWSDLRPRRAWKPEVASTRTAHTQCPAWETLHH